MHVDKDSGIVDRIADRFRQIVGNRDQGYRFVADVHEAPDGGPAVVIETQTISQITVEEETVETDEAESGESFAPQKQAKQLVDAPSRSVFRRPTVLATGLVCLAAAVLGGAYALRAIRSRSTTNRFQQIELRQLTNDGAVNNAAISPDGKLFAFAHREKGQNSLRLGQMNGEAPIELIPPAAVTYWGITFAADGRSIYYAAQENGPNKVALYRLPVLGECR